MDSPFNPDGSIAWPHWCQPPEHLKIDAKCPDCGAGPEFWKIFQPLGETRGSAESGPPQGSGVMMRCHRCSAQVEYRKPYENGLPVFGTVL